MDGRGLQTAAWAVAAVAAVLVALRLLDGEPAPPPVRVGGDPVAAGTAANERAAGAYVHVAGAVRRPGLYRLPAGARVADAVRRAGGAASGANLDLVNLAARLQDGQQVVVPSARAGRASGREPIGLGSATVAQLDGLDGIGPTLARRIVEHRRARGGFSSLDQLAEVEGIGEKRLAALKAALGP